MDYGKYMLNIVWLSSLQDATQAVSHRRSCSVMLETSYALCLFHIGNYSASSMQLVLRCMKTVALNPFFGECTSQGLSDVNVTLILEQRVVQL